MLENSYKILRGWQIFITPGRALPNFQKGVIHECTGEGVRRVSMKHSICIYTDQNSGLARPFWFPPPPPPYPGLSLYSSSAYWAICRFHFLPYNQAYLGGSRSRWAPDENRILICPIWHAFSCGSTLQYITSSCCIVLTINHAINYMLL
jgi:hypothetical protein